jgi:hypothetical protein
MGKFEGAGQTSKVIVASVTPDASKTHTVSSVVSIPYTSNCKGVIPYA